MTRAELDPVTFPRGHPARRARVRRPVRPAVALLVDDDGRLVGLLTDGDVRRAILGGADLDDPALPFATDAPADRADAGSARALVLDLMRALRIVGRARGRRRAAACRAAHPVRRRRGAGRCPTRP